MNAAAVGIKLSPVLPTSGKLLRFDGNAEDGCPLLPRPYDGDAVLIEHHRHTLEEARRGGHLCLVVGPLVDLLAGRGVFRRLRLRLGHHYLGELLEQRLLLTTVRLESQPLPPALRDGEWLLECRLDTLPLDLVIGEPRDRRPRVCRERRRRWRGAGGCYERLDDLIFEREFTCGKAFIG